MMHAKDKWQGLPTTRRSIPKGMLENGYDPAIEALSIEDRGTKTVLFYLAY
ncbi:MAG: hypothetical protein QXJ44_06635 [Candidatus Nitrosocaldus sp.]